MASITLYHNPRCSKSRTAKAILEERGIAFTTVLYLETPPSRTELDELQRKLGASPHDWVRRGEDAYRAAGLSRASSDDAVKDAMASAPILIERPIVVVGDRAVIGRPPDRVLELLENDD